MSKGKAAKSAAPTPVKPSTFTPAQARAIARVAHRNGISPADVIRRAIAEYLAYEIHQERKQRGA